MEEQLQKCQEEVTNLKEKIRLMIINKETSIDEYRYLQARVLGFRTLLGETGDLLVKRYDEWFGIEDSRKGGIEK